MKTYALLILHNLPVEYYPPVTNLIAHLACEGFEDITLVTAPPPEGIAEFSHPGCRTVRYRKIAKGPATALRGLHAFTTAALGELGKHTPPTAVISFEPHSALPVILTRFGKNWDLRLFIHHHEYYRRADFAGKGHFLLRLLWWAEARWNYRRAVWISQTNRDRMERFSNDHGLSKHAGLRILPNHPPRSWLRSHNAARVGPGPPWKLVYVGSLSLEDTYLAEAARWVARYPDRLSLDIFSQHTPDSVAHFLDDLAAPNIRYQQGGIPYADLPRVLVNYHVGLILYRGNTLNFVYNQPNKLFEYLACGLDVWYPREMRGIDAMARDSVRPKIVSHDFQNLEVLDPDLLLNREGLPEAEDAYCAEVALAPLVEALNRFR